MAKTRITLTAALLLGICAAQGRDLPFAEGSSTLAVLPDTQYYAQKYPQHFEAQTRWIAEQHRNRNIVYALHLGDIVQSDAPAEWEVAKRCFAMLDDKVPYLLTPGNHDYSGGTRESRLTEFFPVETFRQWPSFGGLFEQDELDNNVHLFRIGEQDWVALGLEYGPRKKVMEWANRVLTEHRDRHAIIVTHGYLFYNNERYDHRKGKQRATPHGYGGDGADGETLWNEVVRKHPNVMIVICGHVRTGGLGYRTSEGDYGNRVHEMMANYQRLKGGGMAYMRLLEFLPDGKTVQVRTFSPLTGSIRMSELESFRFELAGRTRDTPRPVPAVAAVALRGKPVLRYSFSGEGTSGTKVHDSAGGRHGELKGNAVLNGTGQVTLTGDGHVALPAGVADALEDISLEVWVTPRAKTYNWNAPFYLGSGGKGDALYYTFRTREVHRAEVILAGHNERIQRSAPARAGQPLHILLTVDHDGAGDKALLTYYRNGESFGTLATDIVVKDLDLRQGRLGPFDCDMDEFRIYAHSLDAGEAAGSFLAGPDRLNTGE
jgi:hypothetical protein